MFTDENVTNEHTEINRFRVPKGKIVQIPHCIDYFLLKIDNQRS